jgi:foldase protein PrsA
VLGAAACGGDGERSSEDVPVDAIALIGDDEVPKSEFDKLMERAEKSYKAQKRPFPKVGTKEYEDLKDRAVSFLIQRYQFRMEAEAMGIQVSDDDVKKRLDKIKKETFGGNEKTYQAELKRLGLSEEDVREQIRDVIIQEKLYKEVTKDVKVSDKEVEDYYTKNKSQFAQPATRDVRHILVACEQPAECQKDKATADDLYRQLTGGANFATLAKRFSEDPGTKSQGGKYPAVKGQSAPEFDKVAFALDKGELAKPVKTQFGWHIIEALTAIKPESVTPIAKVEESIRDQLLRQKQSEAMRKWVEGLEKKYEDEIVYAAGYAPPKAEAGATTGTTTE